MPCLNAIAKAVAAQCSPWRKRIARDSTPRGLGRIGRTAPIEICGCSPPVILVPTKIAPGEPLWVDRVLCERHPWGS